MSRTIDHVVFYDIEHLTIADSPSRFWNGPQDPDPTVVQIGAVRLSCESPFDFGETLDLVVVPRDRFGARAALSPFFTDFTGITEARIDRDGLSLEDAYRRLDEFSAGSRLYAWGKDELNLMAVSAYVHGITPTLPIGRFASACDLLLASGVSLDETSRLRSHTILAHFGLKSEGERDHDGLSDARCVARAVQHLLRSGRLDPKRL